MTGSSQVKLGLNSEGKDLNSRGLTEYHQVLNVFGEQIVDGLPSHCTLDPAIDLIDSTDPPWSPIYSVSPLQLKALQDYLDEILKTATIRPSKSPAGAPIIFIPKAHRKGLDWCIDSWGLHQITIWNRYQLPLMIELRDCVQGAQLFTKIDLTTEYNIIRIHAGNEWKAAFRTRYRDYRYLVMPFGMVNAPTSFQNIIKDIFKDMIDLDIVTNINHIFIYSQTDTEHEKLINEVLSHLEQGDLAVSINKCEFHKSEIHFLGYMISYTGINIAQNKVSTVLEWEYPKKQKER
jgi:hypothetical protein